MTDLERHLRERASSDGIDKLVVGAIVHSGGKVLILHRSEDDGFLPGIEELPSGAVEEGESLLEALARELAEEIGWTGPVDLDGDFVAIFDYTSGSGRNARQVTFALPTDHVRIRLSPEHSGHRWIIPDDLPSSAVTPETADTITTWARHAISRSSS